MPYELIRACQDMSLETAVDWKAIGRERANIYAGVDIGRVRDVTCVWLWEVVPGSQVERREGIVSTATLRPAMDGCENSGALPARTGLSAGSHQRPVTGDLDV